MDDKSLVPASLGVVAQQERRSAELSHRGARRQRQRVVLVGAVNVRREQHREVLDDRRPLQLTQLVGGHHREPYVRQDLRQTLVVDATRVARRLQPSHDRLQPRRRQTQRKTPFTRYNRLSNRLFNLFDNRLNVCFHRMQPVVQPRLSNRPPVEQPVVQPV